MIRTTLLVPVRDNAGREFPRRAWSELEERLIAFGGLTREPNVVGVWEAAGRVYRDTSRRYVLALRSWEALPAWLEVVRWARERFRQEAMYIEVAGIPDIVPNENA